MSEITFDSVNEENVYLALIKLKVQFRYQVPLGGGTLVRGGQVIDFVLDEIPPRPVALFVQGVYWHNQRTETEDELKHRQAEHAGYRTVDILEHESTSVDLAADAIKEKAL
jgi:hypothetical protein